MTCPNSDPQFDSFLFGSGLIDPSSPDVAYQRRRVYYTICVLFRLFLAGLVFQLRDREYIPFIVGIAAVVSILNLYPKINNTRQWWSIKFHLVISVALLLSSILVYYKKINTSVLPLIIYASVIGGVTLSFFVKSC